MQITKPQQFVIYNSQTKALSELPADTLQNIQKIQKVSRVGLSLDNWILGNPNNGFSTLEPNQIYLIQSKNQFTPYDLPGTVDPSGYIGIPTPTPTLTPT